MSPARLEAARALVAADLAAVESALAEALASRVESLDGVARHLLASGGKRVRPLLSLLAARASGVDGGAARSVAAASELIHAASLCHDDVLDRGELRRGTATVRARFGDALSILLGDLCLAQAFTVLARADLATSATRLGAVVAEMAEGEVVQAGPRQASVVGCLAVAEAKTGALLGWCATVGGLAPAAVRDRLDGYGRCLGRVYQIVDDVLDLAGGDSSGKVGGQDLRGGTTTVPLILAGEAEPALAARLAAASGQARACDDLIAAVRASGALERARELAREEASQAVAALEVLAAGSAREALANLAWFAAARHV